MVNPGTQPVRHPGTSAPPPVSGMLLNGFARYTRWYLRRHFHAMRVSAHGWLPDNENAVPKVIFLNHASWWDPLVCLHLWKTLFSRHTAYAPIDAKAVEKYAFFRRIGFYGVDAETPRGAAEFLRTTSEILARPWQMLWITPQGRFADARTRPVRFKHGLGHVAHRVGRSSSVLTTAPDRVHFIPLAIEYTYWHERLPEILLQFGEPIEVRRSNARDRDSDEWTHTLEERLESTMDSLARAAQTRDAEGYHCLLRGNAGVGEVYDLWRRCKAFASGRSFSARHGNL